MVHLHPGANFVGWGYEDTGSDGFYERSSSPLVNHGVIVVTVNYRLGVMGFMGHPGLTAEGSLPEQGLLDDIAALKWVQQNIGAFGGDPRNVTLFGMSAGSTDTVALVGSPLTQGLFAHAAVETEFFWELTGTGSQLADVEQRGLDVAGAVSCTGTAVVACLRAMPASTLVLADTGGGYGPLVGGTVQPRSALAAIIDQGARVPLLVGSNREEIGYDVFNVPNPFTHADYVRSVQDLVGSQNEMTAFNLYPSSKRRERDLPDATAGIGHSRKGPDVALPLYACHGERRGPGLRPGESQLRGHLPLAPLPSVVLWCPVRSDGGRGGALSQHGLVLDELRKDWRPERCQRAGLAELRQHPRAVRGARRLRPQRGGVSRRAVPPPGRRVPVADVWFDLSLLQFGVLASLSLIGAVGFRARAVEPVRASVHFVRTP